MLYEGCWSPPISVVSHISVGMKTQAGFSFKNLGRNELTCSHRTWSGCWVFPGCAFVETSVECSEHPSPAAWRVLPVASHRDAMKEGTRKTISFIFHLHQLQGLCYIWLDFSPLISPAGILVFRTENLVHPFQAWTKIKPRSLIPKQDRKARLLPQSLHIFLSATSNQERMSQPAGWVSSISLQGKNLQRHQQAVHFLRGKKGYTYMSYKQTM